MHRLLPSLLLLLVARPSDAGSLCTRPRGWQHSHSLARHLRIAYGSNASEMHVSWTSGDGSNPAVLHIGSLPCLENLASVTAASPLSYSNEETCAPSKDWSHPGYFHHALVNGLKPATRYYFRPEQNGALGPSGSFLTPPLPSPDAPVTFALIADMWVKEGARLNVQHLAERKDLDFVLHAGDLGYAMGQVGAWNDFHQLISPLSSRMPYMIGVGNHEYDYPNTTSGANDLSGVHAPFSPAWWNGAVDSAGECGVPTALRFRSPNNGNGIFWYSFTVGSVHIAVVSSEHDPGPGGALATWLDADFSAVNRSETPWLMLAIHRPLVVVVNSSQEEAVADGLRKLYEPLLLKHRVPLVLSGHVHAFQRTCPSIGGGCAAGGYTQYVNGAGGMTLEVRRTDVMPPAIKKVIWSEWGHSIVHVVNRTAAHLQFTFARNGSVGDDHWVYTTAQ